MLDLSPRGLFVQTDATPGPGTRLRITLRKGRDTPIEMDARVYKFDSVTFDFESTSARAMLQMMADELLYKWIVRGDTLYVYKERNEVLFGQKWLRNKKRAERARKKAREAQR